MKYNHIKGFSLVEVLIAFVILVVGLLGATTLVIRSSQVSMTAYQTEQVAMVVSSFVEKIRFNNDDSAIAEYAKEGNGLDKQNCINTGCDKVDRAQMDMKSFQDQLNTLGLASPNPTWTFTSTEVTINNTKYYQCDLFVKWGAADEKNSYRVNFMVPKVTP